MPCRDFFERSAAKPPSPIKYGTQAVVEVACEFFTRSVTLPSQRRWRRRARALTSAGVTVLAQERVRRRRARRERVDRVHAGASLQKDGYYSGARVRRPIG